MDNSSDLRVLLASPASLVLAETHEEERFLGLLRDIAGEVGHAVWTWSTTSGLVNADGQRMYRTENPHQALAWIQDLTAPAVFVFVDAHPILSDAYVVRRIKETAQRIQPHQTLVFTAPVHEVPPELTSVAHVWKLRPPDEAELVDLVWRTARDLAARGFDVAIDDAQVPHIAGTLKGLSISQAERLVQQAAISDGALSDRDIPPLRLAKAQLFTAEGILELAEADVGTLDKVGGLEGLKKWLQLRMRATGPAAAQLGLPAPRGVLLTGIPGCGKSFVAKTLARTWGQPLVLLDPARLYSKYIGETEQRLSQALTAVDAMAPAVLWIDEIEKGFAVSGGGSDGGVSTRLLGTFLRWMQDRPDGVFVVATANDVRSLPTEFLRKGRFDEIFFVDLPTEAARRQVLTIHLTNRGHSPGEFGLEQLVRLTDGFSGAEIEAGIVGALYRAFAEGQGLSTEKLVAEFGDTVPLSRARSEDIAALRSWARDRAVPA